MEQKFLQLIKTIEENHWTVYGLQIRKDGELLQEYGDTKVTRHPIYSATKSFVSTAAGLAVQEGKFSVKESIYEYLKSEVPAYATKAQIDTLKKLTIERLMTMSVKGYPFRMESEDWLTEALLCPLTDAEPPEFNYSNIPAYLVGVALEKAVGEHLAGYLTPRLFEPLGIVNPVYGTCPAGHFYGASQMELTVEELGRLGLLYLKKGVWNGTRILTDYLCKQDNLDTAAIYGYDREELTHTSVAAQIVSGSADAGMGIYSAAKLYDLDFIPICIEEYDLIIPDHAWDTPMVQQLIATLKSEEFKEKIFALGGYTVENPGEIIPID